LYRQLQQELSEYWDMNVIIFSTGWMGGYGVINAIVRPYDHVIMDHVSHNCLQEGAISATKNLKRFEHLNQKEMEEMVKETREKDPNNAILVVTEGLFSMDADSPDLK
jgi:glycine C-acetyltransferase